MHGLNRLRCWGGGKGKKGNPGLDSPKGFVVPAVAGKLYESVKGNSEVKGGQKNFHRMTEGPVLVWRLGGGGMLSHLNRLTRLAPLTHLSC